jgi:hypothetical protein
VESWTLRHEYLDAGAADGEGVPMWLAGITRTGHVTAAGSSVVSDPEVVFDPGPAPMSNRVNSPGDGKSSLKRFRVDKVFTESGALVDVVYSAQQCSAASLPTPHTNTKRCFPQWYAPGGQAEELDWFHKYVTTSVIVNDLTGASPRMETHYDYLDDPAWAYTDSQLVPKDKRTWAQWRGYSRVRVVQGRPDETQSATEYLFMRGMHGDRATPQGGTRSVQVVDSQGAAIDDHKAHAGVPARAGRVGRPRWSVGVRQHQHPVAARPDRRLGAAGGLPDRGDQSAVTGAVRVRWGAMGQE